VIDLVSVGLRALSLLLLLQATGIALFVVVFGRRIPRTFTATRHLGVACALAALVCVVGQYLLEAGRLAGNFAGIGDLSLQRLVLHSGTGTACVLRVLGLVSIVLGLRRKKTDAALILVAGAVIAAAAFALMGHTVVHTQRWLLAPLLVIHTLIVAFWIGALGPLRMAVTRETPNIAAELVARFSATASWLVPGILLAGGLMAWALVPDAATFHQPSGWVLLGKLGGFGVLMVMAALNKWRLGPALRAVRADGGESDGANSGAVRTFCRMVFAEYALIAVVVVATAVMTMFFSPE
jgi:putative copper export protein